jgi:hypothetical protein
MLVFSLTSGDRITCLIAKGLSHKARFNDTRPSFLLGSPVGPGLVVSGSFVTDKLEQNDVDRAPVIRPGFPGAAAAEAIARQAPAG